MSGGGEGFGAGYPVQPGYGPGQGYPVQPGYGPVPQPPPPGPGPVGHYQQILGGVPGLAPGDQAVSFVLERNDLRFYKWRRVRQPATLGFFGVVVLLGVVGAVLSSPFVLGWAVLTLVLCACFMPSRIVTVVLRSAGKPTTIVWNGDGYTTRVGATEGRGRWDTFSKVEEDDAILLVTAKPSIFVVPKRAFATPAQVDGFRALVRQGIAQHDRGLAGGAVGAVGADDSAPPVVTAAPGDIVLRYVLEPRELKRALLRAQYGGRAFVGLGLFLTGFTLEVVAGNVGLGMLMLVFIAGLYGLLPWYVRRWSVKQRTGQVLHVYNPYGYYQRARAAEVRGPWSDFRQVREQQGAVLLRRGQPGMFVVIPRRAFASPEQYAAFLGYAAAAGIGRR